MHGMEQLHRRCGSRAHKMMVAIALNSTAHIAHDHIQRTMRVIGDKAQTGIFF